MIDPRAIAAQGIGYVAVVVATAGLLFEAAPAVSEAGGGSTRFYEPNKKEKKKEQLDANVSVPKVGITAKTYKPSVVGETVINVENLVYSVEVVSDVGQLSTHAIKNLHDEEFALLVALM